MGYNGVELRIPLRLDNHFGPETARDEAAADALKQEIERLISENESYRRIAILGVEGGY